MRKQKFKEKHKCNKSNFLTPDIHEGHAEGGTGYTYKIPNHLKLDNRNNQEDHEIASSMYMECPDLSWNLCLAPTKKNSRVDPLEESEMREFLPSSLGDLDWSSGEKSLSGRLVQSWESGFAIHLRIGLSEEEGDAFLGALGVDKMEEAPVVKMEGDMEVVDAEFECRD